MISPNVTLTLESVPPQMGGAAAGALQTGQRIGSAIGTATLAAVFYGVLAHRNEHHYHTAIAAALLTGTAFVCLALLIAAVELRLRDRRASLAAPYDASVAQADVHQT